MKLGTLKSKTNADGELVIVTPDLKTGVSAQGIIPSLREAVEHWSVVEPELKALDKELRAGTARKTFNVDPLAMASALPRTWLFADGSSFIHHIKLVRKARNAPLPETLETVPLMYQAESGSFLAPTEAIPQRDFAHGTDMEAEVGVICDFVPMGSSPEVCMSKIRLVVLINDVSLRGLIPAELAQGFGFFASKPAKALSPFALTLEELGDSWKQGRLHLPLHVKLNGQFFGKANAGAMHFHFGQLIAHAAQTRNLVAGTVIGSGTVSNEDPTMGSSCIVEKRMIETIETGKATTPFMKEGDRVEIWMDSSRGENLFGKIDQVVRKVE